LTALSCTQPLSFQSTRPRGARQGSGLLRLPGSVSIHAPAGGATQRSASYRRLGLFQSTRPRGARLINRDNIKWLTVSIHAPAGGATAVVTCVRGIFSFNPRARGGRDLPRRPDHLCPQFQSTRPRGARLCQWAILQVVEVSIHAPAGGATFSGSGIPRFDCFNPRARGGRDLQELRTLNPGEFQSTRPRGARLAELYGLFIVGVSIHAPAGGAT